MDKLSDSNELPYEEQLCRLYEAADRLDLEETLDVLQLQYVAEGRCNDCAAFGELYAYGRVDVCRACARARMRARRHMD